MEKQFVVARGQIHGQRKLRAQNVVRAGQPTPRVGVAGQCCKKLLSGDGVAQDELEPAGARVEPEGAVVLELELERSAARSQAAINEAPSARETATAIVESLMRPPWLGYKVLGANIGPRLLNR